MPAAENNNKFWNLVEKLKVFHQMSEAPCIRLSASHRLVEGGLSED
jgi:hypothetical protein